MTDKTGGFFDMTKQISIGLAALLAGGLFAGSVAAEGNNETAVTVWLVIFNNPAACANHPAKCEASDLSNPAANASSCWLTGQSVQANGRVTVAGRMAEGTDYACQSGPGIVDTDTAEIHTPVRGHGASLPFGDGLEDQVTLLNGGCNPACGNAQFSVHQPADADVNGVSVGTMIRLPERSVIEDAFAILDRDDDGVRVVIHTRLKD